MIDGGPEQKARLRGLIDIAKATLSNVHLAQFLEHEASERRTADQLQSLWGQHKKRDALKAAHASGRFLHYRKLNPKLTDEAIENRIALTAAELDRETRTSRRNILDDPSKCMVPVLTRLGETFLCEGRDGSLRVHTRLLAEWQDLILVVPPMLITAAWMAARRPTSCEDRQSLSAVKNFQKRVQGWLCDSTLPVDDDPFLDQLCRSEGLDETHMHLNGTTEADKIWIDALRRPDAVVGALSHKVVSREGGLHVAIGNGVERLLQQEDQNLSPGRLRVRVEQAIALKAFLLEKVLQDRPKDAQTTNISYKNAVENRIAESQVSRTTAEALHLIDIIGMLDQPETREMYGVAFYWYALLRAQFCRLLVQQVSQMGFDQFQHITLNELRETTEKDFADRFRQIERGVQAPVDFLEGRFAPKTTPDATAKRLMQMLSGYLEFLNEKPDGTPRKHRHGQLSDPQKTPISLTELIRLIRVFENGSDSFPPSERRLRLGLVAHFIKRTDGGELDKFYQRTQPTPVCRDARVRREADQAARALVVLIKSTSGLSELIRGVDAASNERHAGPEVFAQVFRRMRRAGVKRFTYHVGEDFVHLASGLRAISEAVHFLDLSAGCRIGHGTAAGLSPDKWWKAQGDAVVQTLEDRLDDLVFVWGLLRQKSLLPEKIVLIEMEVRRLAMQIWKTHVLTPDVLHRAWKLRHLDPIVRTYGRYDVDPDRNEEIKMFRDSAVKDPDAHSQFLRRHGIDVKADVLARARQPIFVEKASDVLSADVLLIVQSAVLELLQYRSIGIETLPSSNVRISIHETYDDHHISRWLGYGSNFCPTSVVVGSDDPGIFATSLRMEYAHIKRALQAHGAGMHADANLQEMCKASKRYRF
ncbi:MAG: adenosine deaminase [Mameliella sp.]|nr:adenosine deaminase [Mameliella sp.]|tara:strand:- start:3645 stop:6263 length:2619 start_codon:yes stop_codon:yes gene_type:complete